MGGSKRSRDYDWGDYSEKGDRIIAVLGWIVVLLITLYAGIYFGRQTRDRARYPGRQTPVEVSSVQQVEPVLTPQEPVSVSTPAPVPVEPKPVKQPAPAPPPVQPVVKPAPDKAVSPAPVPAIPATAAEEGFSVQVGAFGQAENANNLKTMLEKKGFTVNVFGPEKPNGLYRVRVGSYVSREEAEKAEGVLKDLVQQTLVVKNVPRR